MPAEDDELFGGELERVRGLHQATPSDGELLTVRAHVSTDPVKVLARARQVLLAVLEGLPEDWPANEKRPFPALQEWEQRLPRWFVNLCTAETSEAKITATAWRLHELPPDVRELISHHTAPSLGSWVSCFERHRSWLWWDASLSTDHFDLRYVVFDTSYTSWDLSWLLVAAGAWRLDYPGDRSDA